MPDITPDTTPDPDPDDAADDELAAERAGQSTTVEEAMDVVADERASPMSRRTHPAQ